MQCLRHTKNFVVVYVIFELTGRPVSFYIRSSRECIRVTFRRGQKKRKVHSATGQAMLGIGGRAQRAVERGPRRSAVRGGQPSTPAPAARADPSHLRKGGPGFPSPGGHPASRKTAGEVAPGAVGKLAPVCLIQYLSRSWGHRNVFLP